MSPAMQVLGSIALVALYVTALRHRPRWPRRPTDRVVPSEQAMAALDRWRRSVAKVSADEWRRRAR